MYNKYICIYVRKLIEPIYMYIYMDLCTYICLFFFIRTFLESNHVQSHCR